MVIGGTVSATMLSAAPHVHGRARAQENQVTAVVMRGAHASQPIVSDAPAHLAIAENTGVTLDFQPSPGSDWDTKRQTLLATNQVPDLMYVDSMTQIRDFLDDGVLTPLHDHIGDDTPNIQRYLADNPQFASLMYEGSLYYMPMLYFNWRRLAPMPMMRMDLLQEAGVEAPTSLDELPDVIKAIKEVRPEAVGWTNRNGTLHLLGIIAYPLGSGNGAYFDEEVDGGRWVYGPTKPEFREVLDYLRTLYTDGVIDPEFTVATADDWHTKNSSGQGVFTWDNMSFGANWNAAIRGADPEAAAWSPLEVLSGPKGARQRDYDFVRGGYAIGANASDPAALMRMFDWMLTPEGIDTTNWGIEGQHFTREQPLPDSIESYTAEGLSTALPPDRNTMIPEIFEQFAAEADPFRSFQSASGTGLLDFTVPVDDTITFLWTQSEEQDTWYELTANDPGLRKPIPEPPFNADEASELQGLNREINEILEPAYDQVVLGQISLEDYDELARMAEDMGASRIEEIYNEAQSRIG